MAMGLGWTLNILGFSGGDMFIGSIATYGFICFALLFLPLASFNSYKTNFKLVARDKVRIVAGLICALLVGSSVFFKILNVRGSSQLLFAGMLLFVVGFLPVLFLSLYNRFKTHENPVQNARIMTGLLSGFFVGVGILFKIFHLTGAIEIVLCGAILFIFGFLPLLFFTMYKRSIS